LSFNSPEHLLLGRFIHRQALASVKPRDPLEKGQLVSAGGLDQARAFEDHLGLLFAISQNGLSPCFYRYARLGEL
jgi:hypothetical protein